ncbi:hypothetical protein SAMN05443377_10811 [Propionibacterium cyclohexanicum]|uniref:Lipoprotein n=1 Tax=Propionibacterium cyclohexanicum TaxID=64702 RepID=A0A1H9RL69_9ACTN|nr:hypothetical protein [Propionibacterium cyclohexanicum]SER73601.1 hypothetical protein SAMN05443377_10811 [Propionibacterium cyclohexanicum]
MTRRIGRAPALLALLLAVCTGCAAAPGEPAPAPAPSTASADLSGPKGIEHFDFADAAWFDAQSGQTLQPGSNSSPASGAAWWKVDAASQGNPTQYADLNGDGYEDAVAWLTTGKGTEYWHYAYIWLWDPATRSAHQLDQPITDDKNCGNTTKSLSVSGATITVTRLIRQNQACDQQPDHEVTNTIALEKGVPVRTAPIRASTMPCLAPSSDPAKPSTLKNPLRLAPTSDAPVVGLDQMPYLVLGGPRGTLTDGFHQVLYHSSQDPVTWYCAYTDELK